MSRLKVFSWPLTEKNQKVLMIMNEYKILNYSERGKNYQKSEIPEFKIIVKEKNYQKSEINPLITTS